MDRLADLGKAVARGGGEYQDIPVAVDSGRVSVPAQDQDTILRASDGCGFDHLSQGRR
jgi:hypothetical protein